MKTLSSEINIAFSHLMDGFKDGGRYVNSNILPKITSNQLLRSTLTDILNDEKSLKIIKKLMELDSIKEILKYCYKIDPIVAEHSERVGEYGKDMAKYTDDLDEKIMLEGGYVHDIGKILLPKEILHCGRIEEEKDFWKRELITYGHSVLGELLTLKVPKLKKVPIADVINYHHDNPKIGGYPHMRVPTSIAVEVEALKIPNKYDNEIRDYVGAVKIADHVHAMEREGYQPKYSEEIINFYLIAESNKGNLNKKYVDAFLRSRGLSEEDIKEMRGK